jgi:hypothetical protein
MMSTLQTSPATTARATLERWVAELGKLFDRIEQAAAATGWSAARSSVGVQEDPFGLGTPLRYEAPVLVLRRADPQTGDEQRITFEPRFRFAMGAAGRIDVYSFPRLREAMLLRVVSATSVDDLTWEQAQERVAEAPWRAYSPERLLLDADLQVPERLVAFLEELVQ